MQQAPQRPLQMLMLRFTSPGRDLTGLSVHDLEILTQGVQENELCFMRLRRVRFRLVRQGFGVCVGNSSENLAWELIFQ